jgi:hypothetical protein
MKKKEIAGGDAGYSIAVLDSGQGVIPGEAKQGNGDDGDETGVSGL